MRGLPTKPSEGRAGLWRLPTVKPELDIASVDGRLVNLRLREASTGKRKKPDGVYAATIMRHAPGITRAAAPAAHRRR